MNPLSFFQRLLRSEYLYLVVLPFLGWMFCFRDFIFGSLPLTADAISYFDHIGFYTDNLSKGVYPLWDPFWFDGAPYHFFLRRIGDVNPLIISIVFLKWVGISHQAAYLTFLLVNYFLVMLAFYLIARLLLKDSFFAFVAYLLLLFSSWGNQLFYNYIVLIFLPIIWFFYFLICFAKQQKRSSFLGMCLCLGIVLTTYIPFYFFIILTIFVITYMVFYWGALGVFLKQSLVFIWSKKLFVGFCLFFLLAVCIPAVIFYQESKTGEFVLPHRHAGSDSSSAVAVGIDNVSSGDLINNGCFDRAFVGTSFLGMGEFFIPHLFFLLLLCAVVGQVNKLIFFLFFNVLILSSIATTNAAHIHKFLYDHILFFKFIRNIYYFFWLAILPMTILMVVAGFKALLQTIEQSSQKLGWGIYIVLCHLAFAVFISCLGGVTWVVVLVISLSLLYFWNYLWGQRRFSSWLAFILIGLAVCIQSMEVYSHLTNRFDNPAGNTYSRYEYSVYPYTRVLPKEDQDGSVNREDFIAGLQYGIYYATSWYALLSRYVNPYVFNVYKSHKFIWVDNVFPQDDKFEFFKELEKNMQTNANVAYISRSASSNLDWRLDALAAPNSQMVEGPSEKLRVINFNANSLVIKTHLDKSQFLVINDNYNSGWKAWINGKKVALFRTNGAFKGLWVPSGDSVITLRFLTFWRYALHLSLIALFIGTFIYWIILKRKERLQ